ncbi:sulfite exporter TauE/SafE family protein [Pseudodesulfovibrio portus]|uniref:Probable membrane transporter protein n=1 Tax=Pseudodesulfovibrio portus TaxID=231439 RepID=A0ABM8AN39_9BACT|nr:sulfite exporter TauE/SafE family protein [Pseudodesulfovibrio portus]BDQ32776.1 anion permease [Pseudodesulfovibrio portus]
MLDTTAILGIILLAAFLQGLTGFGFALIALPLLGFFIDIKVSVPLMLLLATIISLYLSFRLRKSINLKSTYILMIATLPGIPLGTYALKHFSTQWLSVGIGVLMVVFTSYMLLLKPRQRELGTVVTSLAGFLCGALGSSIGAGGPPVIIYTTLQPWNKDRAKGTLAFYFSFAGLVTIASHAFTGMITGEVLHLYAMSLPSLVTGIWLGTTAYKHLSDHGYRKLAFVLVFLLGCMMLWRNL